MYSNFGQKKIKKEIIKYLDINFIVNNLIF